jgi:hypothetical protein
MSASAAVFGGDLLLLIIELIEGVETMVVGVHTVVFGVMVAELATEASSSIAFIASIAESAMLAVEGPERIGKAACNRGEKASGVEKLGRSMVMLQYGVSCHDTKRLR